jgi:glucuronoarabinoxylan endo-1,4-beta-xylanase
MKRLRHCPKDEVSMRKFAPKGFTVLAILAIGSACGSQDTGPHTSGGSTGHTGGAVSSGGSGMGGSPGVGGSPGTGGVTSSGGQTGTGGRSGSGGATSPGGQTGTGGATGSGGQTGTGGRTSPGDASIADGPTGLGGREGSGGRSVSGDASAAGGAGGNPVTGTGGSTGTYVGTKTPGTAQSGDITVNPATTYQTMDGFGIADVWIGKSTHTAGLRKLFWDPVDGIGMTLLRIGIDSTGKIMGDAAFVDAPDVVKFGGKVWAAPWSPPANLKDNNNLNNGGHLNTSSYETWATTLAAFPAYFKQNAGVDLWGLSAQNEPDFVASYQSCIFNASQMNAFIKVLGPKLQALNPPVKLIAAEPDVWSHTWNDGDKFGNAIIGDATVSSLVEIIATHDYGSNNKSYTRPSPPAGVKQHVWETEIYYDEPKGSGKIDAGLATARGIYSGVTGGGASGWHYWWTTHFMDGGSESSPPKRVYTMGNYSKFVRPGYVRVGISGVPSTVHMVPFVSPTDGTVAIVALNEGSSAQQVSFFVSGPAWPGTVTPYVTSASSNLAAGTAIPVTAGRFSGSLEAQSVTTFVGKP